MLERPGNPRIGEGGPGFVGDVTIELARMIDAALPGQILVGDFMTSIASHTDTGLAARADVDTQTSSGKFRTPSLRNVVVTAPYMHHGLFQHRLFRSRHIEGQVRQRTQRRERGAPRLR